MKKTFRILVSVLLTAALALGGCGAPKQPRVEFAPLPEPTLTPINTPAPTPEPTPVQRAEPTAQPVPSSAPELKEGDESDGVAELQELLISLNYLRAQATGYYGSKTRETVERFQEENGLIVTGVADGVTMAALASEEAIPCPLPLAGYVIGLDPGHQAKGNSGQEPVAPGASETKKKVSSGTQGRFTGVPEYQVNMEVGLRLRDLLLEQGATVIMTREVNDVDISNVERAQLFNENKTDYALRLHCNGVDDPDRHGAFMLVPAQNPYAGECERAAQLLIDAFCAETGAKNLGLTVRSDQTGFNWCERMIINIEMGHMTNREEDERLTSDAYQEKMARGLLNGILAYFEE